MGKTARQFNKLYSNYKKRFKKPIKSIALLMPCDFTDLFFIQEFKRLYPYLWEDLEKQYNYWYEKNDFLMQHGKKSRYNFQKPYNFILDCSVHTRNTLRKDLDRRILSAEERKKIETSIINASNKKMQKTQDKLRKNLYLIQEIEPLYAKSFIDEYFNTHDLHQRLEIIRELSKFKSDIIVDFFYKVNASTRNMSLKKEAMLYIQRLNLPFKLHPKKKGKTNYIDNEIVENNSGPDILSKRLYIDRLEMMKTFDAFISHNSQDMDDIVRFYKSLNKRGYVVYVDWANDKFDLKRQWCNASTAFIIKKRINQCRVFILYMSDCTLNSQWCPWELGYADALGKKICIYYRSDDINNVPHFYSCYPKLIDNNNSVYVQNDNSVISFDEWINQ